MVRITATTGTENVAQGLTRVSIHVLDPVDRRMRPLEKVFPLLNHSARSSREGKKGSVVGMWGTSFYEVPEGVHLVVRAIQNREATRLRNAVFFAKTREEAGYHRIAVPTFYMESGQTGRSLLEGRFDMLTAEEVTEAIGMPPIVLQEVETARTDWGAVTRLEAEISSRPIIRHKTLTIDGEERKIASSRRRRKLSI